MAWLHPLSEFDQGDRWAEARPPQYWYTGPCPQTGEQRQLPRTAQVEAIAQALMAQLAAEERYSREGKMYGVLLVETPTGARGVLKAFSGLLNGQSHQPGWVPPIPGRAQVALAEAQTLRQLESLKTDLIALQALPERAEYAELVQHYADRWQQLTAAHRQRKHARDRQRQVYRDQLTGEALETALADLVRQSQQDGIERRRLKRERDAALQPLQQAIAQADAQGRHLKQRRQALSQQLQAQMHAVYSLTNFAGATATLQALMPQGLPTGTGDCAAPKLLHHAARHQLKPLALAEFWWGPPRGGHAPGQFYGACAERCQPIMGFLLSGLPTPAIAPLSLATPLPLLYEDEALVVVDKPSGLLSVPGRTANLQDSALSRLRCQSPDYPFLKAVHRLDKGTSGILVLARSPDAHRLLSQQFAQRQVQKRYEAVLSRAVTRMAGTIALPLWRDPADRPKQSVNFDRGKPSLTQFQVLAASAQPRVRLLPQTGRTHQLRVHAAHPNGLNAPILGDTLYGNRVGGDRLHLHAQEIQFTHPLTQKSLTFFSPTPF